MCLVSIAVITIIVLSYNSRRQNIAMIIQEDAPEITSTSPTVPLQETLSALNQPLTLPTKQTPSESHRAVVRVRYTLALSYFDQISNAAHRLQSHQCWASRMASKIVEPFVIDNTYLGGLTSDMDASSATRLGDLFNLGHWNRSSVESGVPPLISWEEFLQTATRKVILVRNHWRQFERLRNEAFRCEEQEFEKLRTFWTRFLKPHGFEVFRELCIDERNHSEFTKVLVNQNSDIDVTVVVDDWRHLIGATGTSLPYMVTDSNCDGHFRSLNWMKPSPKVIEDSDLFISKYLNTDHKYIAVMIRWELTDWVRHRKNGTQCVAKILEGIHRIQKQKNLSLMFLTTDTGNLGSGDMGITNTSQYFPISSKFRKESLACTDKLLQTFFDPSMSLVEYERQYEVLQMKNPAYISSVQKLVAAKAHCLLLIPGQGIFQLHALQLHQTLHTKAEFCTEYMRSC